MPVVLRILLILLVGATASGLVAYLGNKFGRHVGRRKMSIFGLRPRHTSTLITIFTGSMIFLVTLGLAAAWSQDVRQMLVGLDELRREQAQLQQQIVETTRKIVAGQIVSPTQPLSIGVVECGHTPDEIREQIDILLVMANDNVIKKMNNAGEPLGVRSIPAEEHIVGYLKPQMQQLVEQLSREKGTRLCFITNGERPVFIGEKMIADIKMAPNPLIFKKGQVITHTRIDGTAPFVAVAKDMHDFIYEKLQYAALKAGMQRNPLFGKLETSIDLSSIDVESKRIADKKRTIEVQVVANTDIYPLGPLDARLVVLNP